MTHDAATAYACVAYRVMEYDREPLTEEQFEVVLEMLFGFYNEREIEKIYQQNIVFGSDDAIINEEKIKEVKTTGLAGGLSRPYKGLLPACARKAH